MLTTYKGLYVFKGDYACEAPRKAGFKFDPTKKVWWTRSITNARKVSMFADDQTFLRLGKEEETYKASKAVTSDLHIPVPLGLNYYPFQKAGIEFLYNHKKALLADEPGTGKTIQTAGLINLDQNIKKVLIICPAVMCYNWKVELEKWLVRPLSVNIHFISRPILSDILIISYGKMKRSRYTTICEKEWDTLILDESHYIKNEETDRARTICSPRFVSRFERIICLTGTPVLNRPMELWTTLKMLDEERWWSLSDFQNRYCAGIRPNFIRDKNLNSNLKELNTRLRSTIMLRREKKDVLKELPEKIRQIVEIPAYGEKILSLIKLEKEIYDKLGQPKELELLETTEQYEKAALGLVERDKPRFCDLSSVRHQLGLAKFEYIFDIVDESLAADNAIIVYAHHKDVLHKFYAASKTNKRIITGDTPQKQRQRVIKAFQESVKPIVLFGTIGSMGIGVTLTKATKIVFLESSWTPSVLTQAEDRANRIGSESPLIIQHYVFQGSLDATILKRTVEKQQMIRQVCA